MGLWFLAKNKANGRGLEGKILSDRSGKILFIDARQLGQMEDRTHRILADTDIARITSTYHTWRGEDEGYEDVPGFCKSTALDEVRTHGHVLTPGRYVGSAGFQEDNEPFEAKLADLQATLLQQFRESGRLQAEITSIMQELRS